MSRKKEINNIDTWVILHPWRFIIPILILILAYFAYSIYTETKNTSSRSDTSSQLSPAQNQVEAPIVHDILKYRIVNKRDTSYVGTPRMVYRVELDATEFPLEAQLRKTAIHIWEDGNKNWKEFTIFMYLPDMNSNGEAFVVAEFRPSGLKEFRVQMSALSDTKWEKIAEQRDQLLSEMASKIKEKLEKKTGPVQLSTEMKKKIYRELVYDPQVTLGDGSDEVLLQVLIKLMKKYNLSRDELAKICSEGAEKGW